MKKFLPLFLLSLFSLGFVSAQTYQLNGNPVVTTGWTLVPDAVVNTDFIQLTTDVTGQKGAIKLDNAINLKYCDKWKVEFDFRIDGTGTTQFGLGDGLAFWYLQNPPATFTTGGGLGVPPNSTGLMVGFDIFNNTTEAQMSKVHILYGVNNGLNSNIELNNTAGSTFHSADLISTIPFVNATYRHVEVNGEIDPANAANWIITVRINGTQIVSQSFAPAGAAATMPFGYFGFSAATGGAKARHSIKNVKIYVDKVPLIQTTVNATAACPDPTTGFATIDLTAFNAQLTNTPTAYNFTYYVQGNTTPIANPTAFQYTGNTTISVYVTDPTDNYCANPDAVINLTTPIINATEDTLEACNSNGNATFDLTTANVTTTAGATVTYYPTLANLNAGTNQITNPTAYNTTANEVYAKITSQGCSAYAKITLTFLPTPNLTSDEIFACAELADINAGIFDLTSADVTTDTGVTYEYYTSLTNAQNGTNPIVQPNIYPSSNGYVFVKVYNSYNCYSIVQVKLTVNPPVTSSILVDKTICVGERTTLDAGPGFDEYLWSTGETTSSISGVGIGTYSVILTLDDCKAQQFVSVLPAPNPVITKVNVENKTATLTVSGGTAPYQYSTDGILWQDSNVFTNLPRGENIFYVKDAYNCDPVTVNVTVLNLINAITPNDDGINDHIDYSALSYKKDLTFSIYDRYGNPVNTIDNKKFYKWNGRSSSGRKLSTGTYWYHINWKENDGTPVEYSGWVLVKNINQ